MSDADLRSPPTRGRSSARGGRGGIGRGAPRGGKRINGTSTAGDAALPEEESLEDQGELGAMKKKHATQLPMLKDMFPDWTDMDLVFALEESDGDISAAVEKITQGSVSQFSEVKKNKDRARSKVKDEPATAGAPSQSTLGTRGARGRGGFEGARGGRGRGGVERGRGGQRGRGGHASTAATNGSLSTDAGATSVPTTESSAWDTTTAAASTAWDSTTPAEPAAQGGWDNSATEAPKDATAAAQGAWGEIVTSETIPAIAASTVIPEGGAKKSWASMFSQPKPVVPKTVAKQPAPAPAPAIAEPVPQPESVPVEETKQPEADAPIPATEESEVAVAVERPVTEEGDLKLTPSQDPLTEANVEHLPDESHPPATQTVASTAGSIDPRNLTPLPAQQAPIGRPALGGFATSANRLAGSQGRSASFQRRVLEQQEAVVMPGHNAVDRAAIQFGSLSLNGESSPDVDEEREEPETRHAPAHSPPSQPRTSLPPAPRQTVAAQDTAIPEAVPTPKQAPGLPPASAQNQQQIQDPSLAQNTPQEQQMNQGYGQYARYGQPQMQGMQHDASQQQKPHYDPFGHQAQPSYDQYAAHGHQPQQQSQSNFGGMSSATNEYSQYYTAHDQQRYNPYYGSSYGQQHDSRTQAQTHQGQQGHGQHDPTIGQQRSTSGFGVGQHDASHTTAVQQVSNISHHVDSTRQYFDREDGQMQGSLASDAKAEADPVRSRQSILQAAGVHINPSFRTMSSEPNHPAAARQRHDAVQRNTVDITAPPAHKFMAHNSDEHHKQGQQRYEAPGSGSNTPNPLMGGQQQSAQNPQQSQQSMHQAQSHLQQQQGGYPPGASAAFPYGHPSYNSPYQQAYANQFGFSHQLGGYGGSVGGYPTQKQGGGAMYGAPQGYAQSYEQHSSSPANASAFAQNQQSSMRSTSGMGSGLGGLDDYGRQSAQPTSHQQQGGYGGINDPFARSTSGFGTPGAVYGQQSVGSGQEDALKPYGDAKSGPSPALGQPGRPGSAANSAAGTAQTGLPPPQSQHSAFGGGYPGFPGQGSQYGGLGGLGSHQQSQGGMGGQGGYGSYGGNNFNQTYGQYGSRGGWGQQYSQH